MTTRSDSSIVASAKALLPYAGVVTITVGSLVLLGWALDITALKSVILGFATMKPNTALCFVLSGAVLLLFAMEHIGLRQRLIILLCAIIILAIGSLNLAESIFRMDFGIDQWPLRVILLPGSTETSKRMALATAFNFIMIGLAFLLASASAERYRDYAQWPALLAGVISLPTVMGYTYDIEALYKVTPYTSMALHTALMFMVVTAGILLIQPDRGLMAIVTGEQAGNSVARWLLPATLFLPIVLGLLCLKGHQAELYGTEYGFAIFATSNIMIFTVLICWMSSSLNRYEIGHKQAEEALRLRGAALNATANPILITDLKGIVQWVNPAFTALTGYGAEEAVGKSPRQLVKSGKHDQVFYKNLWDTILAGKIWRGEIINRRKDGSLYTEDQTISPVRNDLGEITHFIAIKLDITERKRAEEVLRYRVESEQLIASLSTRFINIPTTEIDAGIDEAMRRVGELTGVDGAVLYLLSAGKDIISNAHEWCAPGIASLRHELHAAPSAGFSWSLEQLRQGRNIYVPHVSDLPAEAGMEKRVFESLGIRTVLSVPLLFGGQLRGFLGFDSIRREKTWTPEEINVMKVVGEIVINTLERKALQEQLLHDSLHDPLTGLPNRILFMDRLRQSLGRASRNEGYQFAVLFLDIDRFKLVNDGLGHNAGDELLKTVASRLGASVRPGDTVARLGGDEFAILLEDVGSAEVAVTAVNRIRMKMESPVNLEGREVIITASVGIAFSDDGHEHAEELLRNADVAMYRAKEEGKARHVIFSSQMQHRTAQLLTLENDLRRAVQQGELLAHYQPIVVLADGRLTGFEALLRWRHPQRGLVSPAEFIPVAEDTGLIVPIGEWILREACRQMREWQDVFPSHSRLTVSVNVSGKQVMHGMLAEQVRAVLEETGLPPANLGLEITESVFISNPDVGVRVIEQLKALGVRLYMDDFGTGYSSLSYLHRLPVDLIKIDRSFVSQIGSGGGNIRIVEAILSLAKGFALQVIAEGVEIEQDATVLREIRCGCAQGYFYSRPLDAGHARALLASPPPWKTSLSVVKSS